ncbi:putative dehydrogenase/reductase [Sphingomonas paucimobilis]|uniref:quinone oxidoreductase family protein n=1 Tax=Sphingobium sp. DC-2 TaxID=1303256 RepID=UPI00044C5EB8|nr:zinc-binding dehydrogenase [Sphingobium sp. DC-2]EZP72000.1 putative dehydrogenase/reductase [Sphingomonas paucimobilis]
MTMMQAIQIDRTGGPEVLRQVTIERPVPGPGELLVKVEACGINYADVVRRAGKPYPTPTPLPFVPGAEIAGTVVEAGEGVEGWKAGDRLIGLMDHGGYAEYALASAAAAIPIPAGLPAELAAAIFIQGMTALVALDDIAQLAPGESVFIEGAAGGLGGLAVQIAGLLGARRIVGGVGSQAKFAAVEALGGSPVIYEGDGWPQRTKQAGAGGGFDVALHMRGGGYFVEALETLADHGRLILYGNATGKPLDFDAQRMIGNDPAIRPNVQVRGCYLPGFFNRPDVMERQFRRLMQWISEGSLKVQIGGVYPLAEAAAAHAAMESRATTGKLLLKP